jgi:hypothetical protein
MTGLEDGVCRDGRDRLGLDLDLDFEDLLLRDFAVACEDVTEVVSV